jgi:hypothetical protein
VNADDFSHQHPRLARDLDRTLSLAQFRIERENRPAPVWTGRMVTTAVSAGFCCGVWTTAGVWVIAADVSRWWLLAPVLLIWATVGASREDISKARAEHVAAMRTRQIGGGR